MYVGSLEKMGQLRVIGFDRAGQGGVQRLPFLLPACPQQRGILIASLLYDAMSRKALDVLNGIRVRVSKQRDEGDHLQSSHAPRNGVRNGGTNRQVSLPHEAPPEEIHSTKHGSLSRRKRFPGVLFGRLHMITYSHKRQLQLAKYVTDLLYNHVSQRTSNCATFRTFKGGHVPFLEQAQTDELRIAPIATQ